MFVTIFTCRTQMLPGPKPTIRCQGLAKSSPTRFVQMPIRAFPCNSWKSIRRLKVVSNSKILGTHKKTPKIVQKIPNRSSFFLLVNARNPSKYWRRPPLETVAISATSSTDPTVIIMIFFSVLNYLVSEYYIEFWLI